MTRFAFVLAATLAIMFAAGPGHARDGAAATVRVVDGDTIEVDGQVVDLAGIDAPEPGQLCHSAGFDWHCGLVAAYELRKRIALSGPGIRCTPEIGGTASDTPGDPVRAECWVGDSSLASDQIRSGLGVTSEDAPERLVHDETFARQAGLGIWGGRFVPPADWRAGVRLDGGVPDVDRDCVLVGDPDRNGRPDRYLSILDADYEQALGDIAAGLAVRLCSDEAARAAGWHR